jgi:hypothetical protein
VRRMVERLRAWIAGRTVREQRLLAVAAVGGVLALAAATVAGVQDDLSALRARVAGRERTLREVRRLAATLRRTAPADDATAAPLLTRLEATAGGVVGHERVAAMTPVAATAADGGAAAVALRVGGATLEEVVRLLHACESQVPPLAVTRLELRKHPDDVTRFEATLEVAAPGGTP